MLANLANRGAALEDLVARANDSYRSRKVAVIHKVPTAWLPVRGPGGKIVSAKVDRKASVDFLGHVLLPGGPLPLAFDVKEVSKGCRWPLSKLEEHQYEYLRDSALTGAFSFVLIGFWELQQFFILPFTKLEPRWAAWKAGIGPASVKAGESGLVETGFLDYLYPLLSNTKKGARDKCLKKPFSLPNASA
ncbi:MAG: Holliday junction resolvase RecU [Peptococcaceae bacterium]|nr:Holliday junction resolvase RecU [Peptococcaceae bacterium]